MQMACVVLQKDGKNWFAEIAVDMDKIQEITRHILALYELYKSYEEKKEIQGLLTKMPKPKTETSRYDRLTNQFFNKKFSAHQWIDFFYP